MKPTILSILLLFAGGCSVEDESQNQKILDLEKTISGLEKTISGLEETIEDQHTKLYQLYGEIVDSCTSTKEEVTTFGVYTLTQTITDQDWDCVSEYSTEDLQYTGGGFFKYGVTYAIVRSPTKRLFGAPWELHVEDIGEFFHISGYSKGAWCCTEDQFLSKKAPYEIVFEEHSYAGSSLLWKDFDDDGYKEIRIEDTNFIQWLGSTASSALPVIYLEYSSDSFKLDKDLMYSEVSKKINNITESGKIKFEPSYGHSFYSPIITEITSELIISGREEEARKFFDDVWPEDLPKKELYWKEFKEKLARSKYWELEVWEFTEVCDWFDPSC